jgi:hypothetical protein
VAVEWEWSGSDSGSRWIVLISHGERESMDEWVNGWMEERMKIKWTLFWEGYLAGWLAGVWSCIESDSSRDGVQQRKEGRKEGDRFKEYVFFIQTWSTYVRRLFVLVLVTVMFVAFTSPFCSSPFLVGLLSFVCPGTLMLVYTTRLSPWRGVAWLGSTRITLLSSLVSHYPLLSRYSLPSSYSPPSLHLAHTDSAQANTDANAQTRQTQNASGY